jgi:hypothetical protein
VNEALRSERRVFKQFERRIKDMAFNEPDMKGVRNYCKRICDIDGPLEVKELYSGLYLPRESTDFVRQTPWDWDFSRLAPLSTPDFPCEFTLNNVSERRHSITLSECETGETIDDDDPPSTPPYEDKDEDDYDDDYDSEEEEEEKEEEEEDTDLRSSPETL